MKQLFLHIISIAALSALIILMSVGVAILPQCCQMAGEELYAMTEHHDCHCQHWTDNCYDGELAAHGHCKITIEKKDLMQHTPQDFVKAPTCIKLLHATILPLLHPYTKHCIVNEKHDQPHSPPDRVGRMKFFSTFII